jgi:hypothetical protein
VFTVKEKREATAGKTEMKFNGAASKLWRLWEHPVIGRLKNNDVVAVQFTQVEHQELIHS